jgi:hypothetical protein
VLIVRDERFRKTLNYLLKHLLGLSFVNSNASHLICNNYNLNFIWYYMLICDVFVYSYFTVNPLI